MLSLGCIASSVPHCFSIAINELQATKYARIRNTGFQEHGYSKFGRNRDFIVAREENLEDPQAGQTCESACGSALKSMTQRLSCAGVPVGFSTSWLVPIIAALPH